MYSSGHLSSHVFFKSLLIFPIKFQRQEQFFWSVLLSVCVFSSVHLHVCVCMGAHVCICVHMSVETRPQVLFFRGFLTTIIYFLETESPTD